MTTTAAPEPKILGSADLARIQDIEGRVIGCIEVAAAVAEQLSTIGNVDKPRVAQLCAEFLENIKAAQLLVQQVLDKPVTDKSFEASSYHAQARAQIAMEKVQVVASQVARMQRVLRGTEAQAGPDLI